MSGNDDLMRTIRERAGCAPADLRTIVSPYRICPVGAHIDHQGGEMLAMAVDSATELVFAPSREVDLESANFPGRVRFDPRADLEDLTIPEEPAWGRYVYATLAALKDRLPPDPRGMTGFVSGKLPGSGLSSSASVILAYLAAWAEVNEIELSSREQVLCAVLAENRYVGVQCGVLDPSAIVGSRRDQLLAIDSQSVSWQPIPLGPVAPPAHFLVLFTGTNRSLITPDFNLRVRECQAAAHFVGQRLGISEADMPTRLGDLDRTELRAALDEIPLPLGRRARHFVEESDRVEKARDAWRRGDLDRFGGIMNDSCRSSIENYETGSPELIALQEIWQETAGVRGARFSGAGFGGCSVALVEEAALESVEQEVARRFVDRFPALSGKARLIPVRSADGLAIR